MPANGADVSRLTPSLPALLRRVDTPTVCNAIKVAQGRRGFNRFTKGTMQHSNPGAPAAAEFPATARIRALLTLVERKTRYTRIVRLMGKRAERLAQAALGCMRDIADQVKTVTFDNGLEFAEH